jgi:hypothetical protein
MNEMQNKTEVSLFLNSDNQNYLDTISSESGDLFESLGHHGPAVENEWMALRLYFNYKTSIDLYSKSKPGLELREARWYPTPGQQRDGWGADYYIVGETVGLGGVRLWDGDNVQFLNPVTRRTANVVREHSCSYMEMISEGVPYMGRTVDVMVRLTVFSGERNAKVEAFAFTDSSVQFVTGLNYHDGIEVVQKNGMIVTWGVHPEDVAADPNPVGAAIIYNHDDFLTKMDDGKQILLLSKPCKRLKTVISSANARESEINNLKKFLDFIEYH